MMRAARCSLVLALCGCDGRTLVLGSAAPGLDADTPVEAAAPPQVSDAGSPDASHADASAIDAASHDLQTDEGDAPNCLSAADCTTARYPHCDILQLECVACLVDGDCDAGGRCQERSGECETR